MGSAARAMARLIDVRVLPSPSLGLVMPNTFHLFSRNRWIT